MLYEEICAYRSSIYLRIWAVFRRSILSTCPTLWTKSWHLRPSSPKMSRTLTKNWEPWQWMPRTFVTIWGDVLRSLPRIRLQSTPPWETAEKKWRRFAISTANGQNWWVYWHSCYASNGTLDTWFTHRMTQKENANTSVVQILVTMGTKLDDFESRPGVKRSGLFQDDNKYNNFRNVHNLLRAAFVMFKTAYTLCTARMASHLLCWVFLDTELHMKGPLKRLPFTEMSSRPLSEVIADAVLSMLSHSSHGQMRSRDALGKFTLSNLFYVSALIVLASASRPCASGTYTWKISQGESALKYIHPQFCFKTPSQNMISWAALWGGRMVK